MATRSAVKKALRVGPGVLRRRWRCSHVPVITAVARVCAVFIVPLRLQRERYGRGRLVEHGDHLIVPQTVHGHAADGQYPVAATQSA